MTFLITHWNVHMGLASFVQHDICEIHSYCCLLLYSILSSLLYSIPLYKYIIYLPILLLTGIWMIYSFRILWINPFRSDQSLSRVRLCNPMNCSTLGLPVHHQLPEFTETHIHWVSDATQPSHPLSSPSPLAPNPSQHQSLFQWVNSSHDVAKVL